LNVMILLFKLHATAQSESEVNLLKRSLRDVQFQLINPTVAIRLGELEGSSRPDIWFHPCGDPGEEDFDTNQLVKIVHYADALDSGIFAKTVGPYLTYANLEGVNLNSTNLAGADLRRANLDGARLAGANLSNAKLASTNLARANLASTNLSHANLTSANLTIANLASTNLNGAVLCNAILYGAVLARANLDSANLSSTILVSANMASADLASADLTSADLTSTDLDSANLTSADLCNARLTDAILVETNFSNAQNLVIKQLEGAHSPLLCNVANLPTHITADSNRDWDRLAAVLYKQYPNFFETLEKAEVWVKKRQPR
jgi:uncharacterized protein YjbI with pentapeptide repeats